MIDVLLAFIQCFTNFLITYLFLTGIFAHRFQNTYVSITIVAIHSLLLALINSLKHPPLKYCYLSRSCCANGCMFVFWKN